MAHKTVVRNKAYQTGSFNTVERHNERKNDEYFNGDVQSERVNLNIHFCRHFKENGEAETYQETFNRLLDEKKIVKHGTKPDAKLFCEMIFDINTTYFDERGGYEYAKKYFEEAYRLAIKEAGSEDYIISAVMHSDERNSALSEKLGRDVYHYHLHVVYVPVVEKKLYFKKSNKNPELAGKLKEVIPQISQSNKWPLRMTAERDGKMLTLNSYSFLQDRYFTHMKAAGFEGFERGERGSTKEHLEVLEYKIQQDFARAKSAADLADEKEKEVAALTKEADKKQKQIGSLDKKLEIRKGADADISALDKFGSNRTMFGQIIVSQDEAKNIKQLAREGVASRGRIYELEFKLNRINHEIKAIEKELSDWKSRYNSLYAKVKIFLDALRHAPRRIMAFLADIIRQPPEQIESERIQPERNNIKSKTEAR